MPKRDSMPVLRNNVSAKVRARGAAVDVLDIDELVLAQACRRPP